MRKLKIGSLPYVISPSAEESLHIEGEGITDLSSMVVPDAFDLVVFFKTLATANDQSGRGGPRRDHPREYRRRSRLCVRGRREYSGR